MATEKTWMVEQRWDVGPTVVPVRSVVNATTRRKALAGAPEAVRAAVVVLLGGKVVGQPVGEPVVLYALDTGDVVGVEGRG